MDIKGVLIIDLLANAKEPLDEAKGSEKPSEIPLDQLSPAFIYHPYHDKSSGYMLKASELVANQEAVELLAKAPNEQVAAGAFNLVSIGDTPTLLINLSNIGLREMLPAIPGYSHQPELANLVQIVEIETLSEELTEVFKHIDAVIEQTNQTKKEEGKQK